MNTPTPIGAVVRGLAAGAVGTGLMTLWQVQSAKLQSSNGDAGEQTSQQPPADPWEQASAPAKVAKRVGEGVFHKQVSADRIPLLTNVMHWGYGLGWGVLYAIATGSSRGRGGLRRAVLFGTGVWAMEYVELVPMGLSKAPWEYPAKDTAMDLSYHLVYGAGVAGAYRLLDRT